MPIPRPGGDWSDYVHAVGEVMYRYHPISYLELGCGTCLGARVALSYNSIGRYTGVDSRAQSELEERMRVFFPRTVIHLIRSTVEDVDRDLIRRLGPYQCALIDAHEGTYEDYFKQHEVQARIVEDLQVPIIMVDDCRIESVAKCHVERWGEPSWKVPGCTGLWVWTPDGGKSDDSSVGSA